MHRIDAAGHVGNLFSAGNPGSGILPTVVDVAWLNAIQEELANAITAGGPAAVTLVKGTNNQLQGILAALRLIKGAGYITWSNAAPVLDASRRFGVTAINSPAAGQIDLTITSPGTGSLILAMPGVGAWVCRSAGLATNRILVQDAAGTAVNFNATSGNLVFLVLGF